MLPVYGDFIHDSSSSHFPFGMAWENFNLNYNCPRVVCASCPLKEKYDADQQLFLSLKSPSINLIAAVSLHHVCCRFNKILISWYFTLTLLVSLILLMQNKLLYSSKNRSTYDFAFINKGNLTFWKKHNTSNTMNNFPVDCFFGDAQNSCCC